MAEEAEIFVKLTVQCLADEVLAEHYTTFNAAVKASSVNISRSP